jgi:PAP2 superfamily
MRCYWYFLSIGLLFCACKPQKVADYDLKVVSAEPYHKGMYGLTEVIMHDIFAPPVASRIYMYANVAGYEALNGAGGGLKTLAGTLNGLKKIPTIADPKTVQPQLCATLAMLSVGKTLTFTGDSMDLRIAEAKKYYQDLGMDQAMVTASATYAEQVAEAIIGWAKKDKYAQTRSYPKFAVKTDIPDRWSPTQPDYLDALEPHWKLLRPALMDSATQIKPAPPQKFSTDKNSAFFKESKEVWQTVVDSNEQRMLIARFFDDSPMSSEHIGHVTFTNKKITPPGHWLNIIKTVSRNKNLTADKAVQAYALTSVAMFDAVLSCWTEKYRSNLLRPLTYINKYIDPEWSSLLQTPPFPEHTSGHSCFSGAASEVLNDLIGKNVSFADSTETIFGMPVLTFPSFSACADSAAISRMYGGIHYRTGIEAGVEQGRNVGRLVLDLLKKQ